MDEDYTIYREENLFAESLSVLREIRRQGRLCDIILKVVLKFFFHFPITKNLIHDDRSIMKLSQRIESYSHHKFRSSTRCSRKITQNIRKRKSS